MSNKVLIEKESNSIDDNFLKLNWLDLVEENNLDCNQQGQKFNQIKQENKFDNIEDIILIDHKKLNDLQILGYQTIISGYLRKTTKSLDNINDYSSIDLTNFINNLDWLINTSKYLSNKIGLPNYIHKISEMKNNLIPRSSYKFCENNYGCEYNYNFKKYKGCFAQHYVHNMVSADLEALKNFVIINKNNICDNFINELKKSINTISFVIAHMNDELNQIFNTKNKKILHIDRNIKKTDICKKIKN
ncbi:Hypothetical protein KVN_LOCUS530 [uncultured virus]|nr:Hypothetical protein KVN_LOCUS530 [uncultured virus]